ncbi:hypothetical protein CASFOL_013288 [Castilleja foliolosa]|uniref:Dirigent protein n=1 Tax=Castilleja foliolosa TaxID=1961234 RepID=A0ABD3DJN7_9LAMI
MAKLSIIFPLSSLFIISLLLPLAYSKTKVTNIRLYLQVIDIFNETRPVSYGDVNAFQDLITVGPNPNSTLLGKAQVARYKGSTVVAVGRNNVPQSVREFPIVGGTGAFKLARGIVRASTYSTNNPPIFIHDLEIV